MVRDKLNDRKIQFFLWFVTAVSITLNAYLVVSHGSDGANQELTEDQIVLNDASYVAPTQNVILVEKPVVEPKRKWIKDSDGIISIDVNRSDKLISLLNSAGIEATKSAQIVDSIHNVAHISTVKPGTRIQIQTNGSENAIPKKVLVFLDTHKIETTYNSTNHTYVSKRIKMPLEWQVKLVSGTINGSLMASAKKAGAESSVINQLVSLYSHSIDFQRDLHAGDTFKIMYEYQTDYRGKMVKNPKIMYSSLNLNSNRKELFRTSNGGQYDYYDRKGVSIKKALLRTPIHGAKISSHFGIRSHPVYGYSKMHQGLDYSAPKGTPILAAGDGKVEFVKNLSRGYGKHVQIRHNSKYATMYAHMSRFASNLRPGISVKQGQVIGYVGDTGLASGPHLHYEVIQEGKKVNPSKVNAPMNLPLAGKELAKFKETIRKLEQMVAELDDKRVSNVAANIGTNAN